MLDRARDADRHIQLRRNDLAGLADLIVVRYEARIHCRARCAQRCVQLVRQRLQNLRVVLAIAETTATRDDDLRRGQLRTVQLRHFTAHELREARVGCRFDLLNRCAAAFCCHRVEAGRANRDDLDRILRLNRGDSIACIDRALERIGAVHCGDVADLRDVELRGDTRRDVLAVGSRRREDVRVVLRDVHHGCLNVFRQTRFELRGVGQQDLRNTCNLRGGVRCGLRVVTCHQHVDIATNLLRGCNRVQRRGLDRRVVVFSNYQIRHFVRLLTAPWLRSSASRPASSHPAPSHRRSASAAQRLSASSGAASHQHRGLPA
ncbi:hypothetical protein R69776_08215 [Paraburkholderia nemoris]|uniref:Uncharacterized protein n=1 Tax=Paraburkholderia nemoris TaxID=2793076 RepID=A0ABN7NCH8_9BURK|nr:hypothetical protein R69776_08215 [Paraburkholderia nemoris]